MTTKESLIRAVNDAATVVKSTYGPNGKKVFIGKEKRFSRDGMTVAAAVANATEGIEHLGASLLLDACQRTAKVVGDGTTTTAVLLSELLSQSPDDLDLLKAESRRAVEFISNTSWFPTREELVQAVTASANNNIVLGEQIAGLVWEVGPMASIQGVPALGEQTRCEVRQGYLCGHLAHPKFFTHPQVMRAKTTGAIINPRVLLVDETLEKEEDAKRILVQLREKDAPTVVIAPSFGSVFVNVVLSNLDKIPVFLVVLKDDRPHSYTDVSIGTGAAIFSTYGKKLHQLKDHDLGTCQALEIRPDGCRIVFDIERKPFIDEHLQKEEKNAERIGQLAQGVGIVYIGGETEAEHKYLSDVIEDAVMAAQSCMRYGVVPGAGKIMELAAQGCRSEVLKNALLAPSKLLPVTTITMALDPAESATKSIEHAVSLAVELFTTEFVLP